jgi:hypothetical protein
MNLTTEDVLALEMIRNKDNLWTLCEEANGLYRAAVAHLKRRLESSGADNPFTGILTGAVADAE